MYTAVHGSVCEARRWAKAPTLPMPASGRAKRNSRLSNEACRSTARFDRLCLRPIYRCLRWSKRDSGLEVAGKSGRILA